MNFKQVKYKAFYHLKIKRKSKNSNAYYSKHLLLLLIVIKSNAYLLLKI